MNRVETININGIVFSIDDDAFGKLGSYLDALGKYFEDEQGGREIIADIEARIAELFAEREGGVSQVVTLADVAQVIGTLGTPEDIAGADSGMDQVGETSTRNAQQTKKSPKHLYRDPDQRYLGGVCSGIAAWLGVSPLAVRLAFLIVAFFYGVSVIFYCILWIIIPKAKTTTQKLEMRGEPVTISNIERNIKENLSDPNLKQSFRNFLNEAGEFLGKFLGVILRIIAILVGLFLCVMGICLGITAVCVFLMQDIAFNQFVDWDFFSFNELLQHLISPASYVVLLICAVLVAALLVFAILFWGVKLVAGFKVKHKMLHVALAILWLAAVVTGVVVSLSQARNYAWRNEQLVETKQITPSDTLYLAVSPSQLQISNNPAEIYFDKDNNRFYGKPELSIRKSEDGLTKLRFSRESQGENKRAAYQFAENIAYNVDVQDSLLTFAPYFMVTPQDKWKFQTLDISLYIPEGTIIVANKALCNDRSIGRWVRWNWSNDCSWIMTKDDGLQPTKRED